MKALTSRDIPPADRDGIRLPRGWDDLSDAIPPEQKQQPLSAIRRLPARIKELCEARGIETIGGLVALPRAELLRQRDIGPKKILRTYREIVQQVFFRKVTGTNYPVIAGGVREDVSGPWDGLRDLLPPALAELPVSRAGLPSRMRKFAASRRIENLGELVRWTSEELLSTRGIGRVTVGASAEVVRELIERIERGESLEAEENLTAPFSLDEYDDFARLWRARLESLPNDVQRMVIAKRSGTNGTAETLAQIGAILGVTRERVRQIEARAIRRLDDDRRWVEALARRLESDRGGRVVPLSDLAADPFWSPLFSNPDLTEYVFRHFLGAFHTLARWNGGWVVADFGTTGLDRAFYDFLDALQPKFPFPRAVLAAQARRAGERAGKGCGRLFEERIEEHFLFDSTRRAVLGTGATKWDQIRAYLMDSPGPVPLSRLEALFGRMPTRPPDILLVRSGQLTLPAKIPGFEKWEKRLVPHCLEIMRERGPTLQWMADDLLDALREVTQVPDFVTPWLLAGMLRRSGQVVDLRRQRFALREAGSQNRVLLTPTLLEYVERAGRPVARSELREYLSQKTTFRELSFNLALTRLPLLPVDEKRVGLLDRDVPGGREAMVQAGHLLKAWLEERGEGLAYRKALTALQGASSRFEKWTPEMVAAVPRMYPDLCSNRSGIGLARWGEVRIPTRAHLVQAAVDEGRGEARISTVMERVKEVHGVELSRASLGSLAYQLGLRVEGDRLVAKVAMTGTN